MSARTFYASLICCLSAAAVIYAASVGSGAATPAIQASFINAYYRGPFGAYVGTPTADVRAFGTTGLIQEFPSLALASQKYALIKPDPNAPMSSTDTLQVYGEVYTRYLEVGVGTAGFPTTDTLTCPVVLNAGTCAYQLFTKNYAIFIYSSNTWFALRDPFYTVWSGLGGVTGPGAVTSAETAVTSVSQAAATRQDFTGGQIFSYPAGAASPSVYGVTGPFFKAWSAAGGLTTMGLPTSAVVTTGTGLLRQTFEFGRVEQAAGATNPVAIFAVAQVSITTPSQNLTMSPGDKLEFGTSVTDSQGAQVTGRALTWSTTNGAVVRVQGHGESATIEAIGAGTASVQVTSEGKVSAPVAIRVRGVCCAIGDGAPDAVAAALQTALNRNQLSPDMPVPAAASRIPGGYVQVFTAGSRPMAVSIADSAGLAYVSSGTLYAAYLATGGFSGPLGFPASDLLAGNTQRYASGAALSGDPVRVVPSAVAAKWFASGGGGGSLGSPVAAANSFSSVYGTAGQYQLFDGGAVFASMTGSYLSGGAILSRYLALGGPESAIGAPITDLGAIGSLARQDFEGGYIDLQPGSAVAVEHLSPRQPAISVKPAVVVPGGRVVVSAKGFSPGAELTFTITGQPPFTTRSASGAFSWEILVAPAARPGDVQIRGTATGSTDVASAAFTVTSAPSLLPRLTLLSGDQQTGVPGAQLLAPIVASLVDSNGAPMANVPVGWTLSPGAAVTAAGTTDANGQVAGLIRLPAAGGVITGAINAAGKVVTFSALAAGKTITGFPRLAQTDTHGGLVAALAALIQYGQGQNLLPSPSGQAGVTALSQYLAGRNGYSSSANGVQVANPWVAAQFAGAGLSLESSTEDRVRDLLADGKPSLVMLRPPQGRMVAVNATGVRSDGAVLIADPDPASGKTTLAEYGGILLAVVRVVSSPSLTGAFTVATPLEANAIVASDLGVCPALEIGEPVSAEAVRYAYCDGTRPAYQFDNASTYRAGILDLGSGTVQAAAGGAPWVITRTAQSLTLAAAKTQITSVTEAAGFTPALAPRSIISIFGSGLTRGSEALTVSFGGIPLPITFASPFQLNAVLPAGVVPGSGELTMGPVTAPLRYTVAISPTAPAIFVVGPQAASGLAPGAILNLDGTLNGRSAPAARGQFISIYCTGLGATTLRGGLLVANSTVTVTLGGSAGLPVQFAGAVSGFPGLYQVNLQIPAGTAPGVAVPLALVQDGKASRPVSVAIQ